MSQRVLSTDVAGQSAKTIVQMTADGGSLVEQLKQVKTLGQTLSDPNVWDGSEANTYRSQTWPAVSKALEQAVLQLGVLGQSVKSINANIRVAGGDAAVS